MSYVTVSAKVRRDLWDKLKKYGINISKVIREAIERKIREEEIKWSWRVMDEIASKAMPERPISEIIREHRDRR